MSVNFFRADFWQQLPRPFLALAPMYGVTDYSFREVLAKVGPPDVFFTEFVPARVFGTTGEEKVRRALSFTSPQRPIVAQIWGVEPDFFARAARIVAKLGFDGIDLNFGCPDREVVNQGAGAALIGNFQLTERLILAVQKNAGKLAVSIKTRLAGGEKENLAWFSFLLDRQPSALIVHGRTARQKYDQPADWTALKKLVRLKSKQKIKTVIVGNGDVADYPQAVEKAKSSGVDGVMIGRAALANPWVFRKQPEPFDPTPAERLMLLRKHIRIYRRSRGPEGDFNFLKKFFKAYVSHFPGAVELRRELMACREDNEVKKPITDFLKEQKR